MKEKPLIGILASDYSHELYDIHDEKRKGRFDIKKLIIPEGSKEQFYHKEIGVTRCIHLDDYPIVQLREDQGALMTDTPFEIETNKKAIKKAKGDVLECGLGLGYFTYHASHKKNVNTLTILEHEKNIIDLVYPIVSNFKTDIIQTDAIKYFKKTKRKYDMINIDFVGGMVPYRELEKLKLLTKRCLKPKGVAVFWQEDTWKLVMKNIKKGATVGSFTVDPCISCGKQYHTDYHGFCMDCADSLGVSELFVKKGIEK